MGRRFRAGRGIGRQPDRLGHPRLRSGDAYEVCRSSRRHRRNRHRLRRSRRALERVPQGETLYIVPTYTAMLAVRGELERRGYVPIIGSKKMSERSAGAPELRLGHLYPDQLNVYGDRGNIIVLKQRCAWRGIQLRITRLDMADALDPSRLRHALHRRRPGSRAGRSRPRHARGQGRGPVGRRRGRYALPWRCAAATSLLAKYLSPG